MAEIWFYHLQRRRLEDVLPTLLQKTLERGWRAAVESRDEERLISLDGHLWTFRDESFLPHGMANEPNAPDQPILLTTGPANVNGAAARFLIDGAETDDPDAYERVIYLFDGRDQDAVATARAYWKSVGASGHTAVYWQETDRGGWEKKA